MGQLFSVLRSWQCFGAECHSTCMDDCCTFDFHRDAQASEEEELDLPYVHWAKKVKHSYASGESIERGGRANGQAAQGAVQSASCEFASHWSIGIGKIAHFAADLDGQRQIGRAF